ncbi:MAG: hypothetical protein LW832_08890 [Parachlamydia sp.]|jgi:hypothetical protein|nr:hypothetical protein [Parachlamydia sp.]
MEPELVTKINSIKRKSINDLNETRPLKKRKFIADVKRKVDFFLHGKEFYIEQQPANWYPLEKINGKIKISLPKEVKTKANLIYIFRNKETGQLLIGKTGTTFAKRLGNYMNAFNNKSKDFSEGGFVQDVQKNPTLFEVGMLYPLQAGEDLNEMEENFIDCLSLEKPLYNQRKGGAGGLARTEELPTEYAVPKQNLSPSKYYPCREVNGKIRPDFSPTFHRTVSQVEASKKDPSQGCLYVFKNVKTNEKYIGATTQENKVNRLFQHCYLAEKFNPNNKKKYQPDLQDGMFHPALGSSPTDFAVNFIPIKYDVSAIPLKELKNYAIVTSLGKAETAAIKASKLLLNCRMGGGGPISDLNKKKSFKVVH